jgi:hypothetical protein
LNTLTLVSNIAVLQRQSSQTYTTINAKSSKLILRPDWESDSWGEVLERRVAVAVERRGTSKRCDMTTAASLDGGSVGGSHRVRVVGLLEAATLVDIEAMGWR